jgi:hypothetical protein
MSNILQMPLRICSSCKYWDVATSVGTKGYIERVCVQPPDNRDRHLKRGSDKCSHWESLIAK